MANPPVGLGFDNELEVGAEGVQRVDARSFFACIGVGHQYVAMVRLSNRLGCIGECVVDMAG